MTLTTRDPLLLALSPELQSVVFACLDLDTLLALEAVCTRARTAMREAVEARCKRECFSTYIYPTIAAYGMVAAVPKSWKKLYLRFSRLQRMQWAPCKSEGTSSSLRALKVDNQEYTADLDNGYLLRSGGHYWFSVLQTPLADASLLSLGASGSALQQQLEQLTEQEKDNVLEFLRSPTSIRLGKWEKLRAEGSSPCPRRHHSMTCLPNVWYPRRDLSKNDSNSEADGRVPVRRILFFGGQREGIPFEAFNDLHMLLVNAKVAQSRPTARWVRPEATGQPPSRRCGHDATLLSGDTLLVSGGSDGTPRLYKFEVFLLHIESDEGYGRFRWSTPRASWLPDGRAMHSVHKLSKDEVLIFGGRQIRGLSGLLDVQRLELHSLSCDGEDWEARWSEPTLSGCVPTSRCGHSAITIGDQILLIGGQDVVSGELFNDVRILHLPSLRWSYPQVTSDTTVVPCARRGFKTQFFGTMVVLSSGFVANVSTKKVDQQLPHSDIHVLTFR